MLSKRVTTRFRGPWLGVLGLLAFAPTAGAQEEAAESSTYAVDFEARIVPTERSARVTIRLGTGAQLVKSMRFRVDPERHRDFRGDGEVIVENGKVEWRPPAAGGALRYVFSIDQLRNERSYEARIASQWAVFRGDDLVPAAHVRTETSARSRSLLHLKLPEGWSAAVPYPRRTAGGYTVSHPNRRFDRPTGWMVLGKIGVLREEIAGTRVSVAGPVGHDLRRLDILTLLHWALPTAREIFGTLPDRILIAGAGDPMWRGGLSGPNSVFIHADRPLLTEDGSSPILHELVHAISRPKPGDDGDWVAEGLAELYSIELLRRSGTISESRYEAAMQAIAKRAGKGGNLRAKSVTGDTTAKAVVTLRALDAEIRKATDDARSLDDVLRALSRDPKQLTTQGFQEHAEAVAGVSLEAFFARRVPAASP